MNTKKLIPNRRQGKEKWKKKLNTRQKNKKEKRKGRKKTVRNKGVDGGKDKAWLVHFPI